MIASANHHFIAQAILRNFCFNGNQLFFFSKNSQRQEIETRNIQRVFKKRHLNSYPRLDGSKDDSLEKFFAKNFDEHINEVVKIADASVLGNKKFQLNEEVFAFFVQFLYNHIKRSPDFHDPVVAEASRDEFFDDALSDFQEKYGSVPHQELKDLYSPEVRKRIVERSRVVNLSTQSTEILEILAEMTAVIATPEHSKAQFIIGSNPVARLSNSGKTHLQKDNVELWTTLKPNLAIGLVKVPRPIKAIRISNMKVQRLNRQLFRQSSSVASSSKELLQNLTRTYVGILK